MLSPIIIAFTILTVAAAEKIIQLNCDNRDSSGALQILNETEFSAVNITGCTIYETTLPNAKLDGNASIYIQDSWFMSGTLKAGTFRNKSIVTLAISGTDLKTIEVGALENNNVAMKSIILQKNPSLNLTVAMFRPITFTEALVISDVQIETFPEGFFDGISVFNLTINALGLTSAPNDALKPLLSSLYYLEISENQLSQLSLEIESQSLQQLYLVNDQIAGINSDSFSKLPNLEVLSLVNNQLSDVDPSWFRENSKLKFIYLHTNRLVTLNSDAFNWPIVEKIALSDNFWDCTCELYRLAGQLSKEGKTAPNEFVCFSPDEHKDLQLLGLGGPLCGETTTTISTTTTRRVTKRAKRTTSKADEINLTPPIQCKPTIVSQQNTTDSFSTEENTNFTMTYDCEEPWNNTLVVADNSSVPKVVVLLNCLVNNTLVEQFGNVSAWTLSGASFDNRIQQNGSRAALKSLTITQSDLLSLYSVLHGYLQTAQLESLVLSDNENLELQADSFSGMSQLTSLKISNSNSKNGLPNDIFVGLPLRLLALENLALRSVPSAVLKPTYETLERLTLRNNAIRDVSAGLNALRLTELDLSGNFIRTIRGNAFAKLANLQTLSLATNRLTNLDPQLFKYNARLNRLDISGNTLISISTDLFKPITLTDLNLRRNPWSCTCQLYRLVKFLPASNTDKINCYWPTGLTLIDVGTKICGE